MYKEMIEKARSEGKTNEQAMWKEIENIDTLLEGIKEAHPDMYWKYIRKAHKHVYGCHYTQDFAEYDIEKMHSTDKEGNRQDGAHWTKQQVLDAWQGKVFSNGTTDCDKWVAANAIWHDLNKEFTDQQILDVAFLFFFADEDYEGTGKVWEYMN